MAVDTGREGALAGGGRTVREMAAPLRRFLATESGSAMLLLAATVVALVWANSPLSGAYEDLWGTEIAVEVGGAELREDLRHWVNDGLMVFFFFVVGLEIRRELEIGDLRDRRTAAAPALAALGGMVMPAALYLAFNLGGDGARGWGIAMATDLAFALGVLALLGPRCPNQLRIFLLTLAIVDDIGAILVIALFYTSDVDVTALVVAAALFGVVLLLRRLRVWRAPAYFTVGVGIWVAMVESGVHPTIAGVAMGMLTTAYAVQDADVERAGMLTDTFREEPTPATARQAKLSVESAVSSNERLQYLLHPWTSYFIVPLFALANAGVEISGEVLEQALTSPIALGIIAGLVIGKPLGIALASFLAVRSGVGALPRGLRWPQIVGAGAVAGIGFTVALFIADLAFDDPVLQDEAKIGILVGSLLASILGWATFQLADRLFARAPARLGPQTLTESVDPARDHIRGPAGARFTLLEYGDFECPYCGRAAPAIGELLDENPDLRFVFRHLPLPDVHLNARRAAEAAEAASAQGAFWEMHDRLYANQDALEPEDLPGHAAALGLDVERFEEDLRRASHRTRVEEDEQSAADSGADGTPTFFVNGRRHEGRSDIESLRRALEQARERPQLHAGGARRAD